MQGDVMERLQKVIASSGYCSRRKAEELILKGKVLVNGQVVRELGIKISGNDEVVIDNNVLVKENKEYILLYKPRGVVTTTSDDKKRKTVIDLVQSSSRVYPVGRLDYDTTGVLLLTNDGEITNLLTHPKNEIDKVYIAKIKGIISKEDINKLRKGVVINGFKTAKARVKLKSLDKKTLTSIVELVIHEGKNHQVKKMFEAIGYEVIKLKRERVCFLDLNGLQPGEYRHLSVKEVHKLYNLLVNGK